MTRAITLEYYACQSSASFVFLWGLKNSGGWKERSLSVGTWIHTACIQCYRKRISKFYTNSRPQTPKLGSVLLLPPEAQEGNPDKAKPE